MRHPPLLLLLLSWPLLAATRFTLLSPENPYDDRLHYYRAALQLALEKTRADYGDYELRTAPPMNKVRMRIEVQKASSDHLVTIDSWPPHKGMEQVGFAAFPFDLGILSYRVCFVAPGRQSALDRVETLAQLQPFSHVQGRGWQDVDILRHAGLTVYEVESYEAMFRMVARGRVDLFCRGINEIAPEWQSHQPRVPGLAIERHLALYYPQIHLLYSHVSHKEELARIELGLRRAWQDGSLQQLWRQHFQASIDTAGLCQRRLIRLDNPFLPDGGRPFLPYLYDPDRDAFGLQP